MQVTIANLGLVEEYIKFRSGVTDLSGVSYSDKQYYKILRQLSNELTKPFQQCDELDIEKYLEIHCKSEAAWNMYLAVLRVFFAWIANKDSRLPKRKWKPPAFFELIDRKDNAGWKYGPEDMWNEEEILTAIAALDHPRDKAMIAMLYDLAARPHELMSLKIRNVVLRENYAEVKLVDHSNPEGRIIPVTFSFPYFLTWLNSHPLKDNPDAPLWVRTEGAPKAVRYYALWSLCSRKLRQRLGHKIHKPFNPYCMGDHSRLTNWAEQGLTEFQLKKLRGWSMSSTMPKRYIHMSGQGVKDRLLELAGIKKPEQSEKESPLKAKECYRCKHKNPPDAKFCQKCNFVLSAEAFEEMQEKEKEREGELQDLRKLASLQIHAYTEHGGRPSKKCQLCKRMMSELSSKMLTKEGKDKEQLIV